MTVTLTERDLADPRSVSVGDRVIVQLGESPTSGFRWEVSVEGGALSLTASDYAEPKPGTVGGQGVRTFTFSAMAPGRSRLVFVLKRRWEAGPTAGQTRREATIEVRS